MSRDLFRTADRDEVLHGAADRLAAYTDARGMLACERLQDDAGNDYVVVPGTPYVGMLMDSETRRFAIWNGGLCGHIEDSDIAGIHGVIEYAQKQVRYGGENESA